MDRVLNKGCILLLSLLFLASAGCAPALIGAGATGTYKVATDERTTGKMWDDSTLTIKIKTALIENSEVSAGKIDVDTVEGRVTLSGVVPSTREATEAVRIARGVEGVRSVRNNLLIGSRTTGQAIDDQILGNKIKARLITEPGVRSFNIDVDVYKGVVTLTGAVSSQSEKEKITGIASKTEGIRRLIDNITVK